MMASQERRRGAEERATEAYVFTSPTPPAVRRGSRRPRRSRARRREASQNDPVRTLPMWLVYRRCATFARANHRSRLGGISRGQARSRPGRRPRRLDPNLGRAHGPGDGDGRSADQVAAGRRDDADTLIAIDAPLRWPASLAEPKRDADSYGSSPESRHRCQGHGSAAVRLPQQNWARQHLRPTGTPAAHGRP
jgi:hypothetical protein